MLEGQTSDPWIGKIWRARVVNQYLGFPYVSPETVDDQDPEVTERILALVQDLPEMMEGQKQVEELKRKIRERSKPKR